MDKNTLKVELNKIFPEHKIKTSYMDLIAYASDASFYRLIPQAIVQPSEEEDIKALFVFCTKNKIPLTFRGGGTSLSGQSITDGILVDLTKHFRKSLPLDGGNKVWVQPGITGSMVNAGLRKFKRKIGPDPSSIASAMMGGILANNSSGMCCGVRFNSYHTLSSIKIILPNSKVFDTKNPEDYIKFQEQCPHIFNKIIEIKERIGKSEKLSFKIREKYNIKNTVGYSLNSFLDFEHPLDILAHLLIGSEGTLGFIAEAILNTIPDLPFRSTGLLYFANIFKACSAIIPLKNSKAEALELMDRAALLSIEDSEGAPVEIKLLPAEAAALLCEYQSDTQEGLQKMVEEGYELFKNFDLLYQPIFTTENKKQELLWKIRKGMFPSVGAVRMQGTSVILEDVAFPLENLAEAVTDIQQLFKKHHYNNGIIFGHAKDGNIHFVVSQSFNSANKIQQYEDFIKDVVELVVVKHHGTLKAEHGTGRNMAPFVETEWGSEAYAIMKEIKKIIDPENILNAGVIINEDKRAHLKNLKSMPVVEQEVDKCIECGYCEHSCPSKDLTTTPRQRIVVRREMARAKAIGDFSAFNELWKDFQYKGIETCAVDGLCAVDCPVNINTGELTKRLRKENHSKFQNRIALQFVFNFRTVEFFLKLILKSGSYVNTLFGRLTLYKITTFIKKGIPSFPLWPQYLVGPVNIHSTKTLESDKDIIYFPTCITRCMGKSIGENSIVDAIKSLCKKARLQLYIPDNIAGNCCGQAFSSKGYTVASAAMMERTIENLWIWSHEGNIPIVTDVTSCTQTIKNCQPFISESSAKKLDKLKILDTIDFAEQVILPRIKIIHKKKSVVLHPVCSLTKMKLNDSFRKIATLCSDNVTIPLHAGCCGMAGDRGFFYPELTSSAVMQEAGEVLSESYSGYYSSAKTCEISLSENTQQNYESILFLLDDCTANII